MLVAFYHTEDEGVMAIHTSLSLLHSHFPCIPASLVGRLILSHFILKIRHLVIDNQMCVKFCFQIRTKIERKGCSQCGLPN
jgi:hypothetical protein